MTKKDWMEYVNQPERGRSMKSAYDGCGDMVNIVVLHHTAGLASLDPRRGAKRRISRRKPSGQILVEACSSGFPSV